ncbi:MAG: GGDEF domain-containing protein [Candidatus Diapherotrites archaeon]|uniref:GGDEF domain-containing protein n=1 Tax=Candidatus Iainarchaeum sp. TaxID=3101447 RepID=A0A8T4L5Y2_9ARCH|nr:GGDEF domain-containing protein [Candidatus Diapherotrites archaeon]
MPARKIPQQKANARLRKKIPKNWDSLDPKHIPDKRQRDKLKRILPIPGKLKKFLAKRKIRPFAPKERGFRLPNQEIGPIKRATNRMRFIYDHYWSTSAAEIAQRQRLQKQIHQGHSQFTNLTRWEKRRLNELLQQQIAAIGRERGRFQNKYKVVDDRIDDEALRRLDIHPDYPAVHSRRAYMENLRDALRKPGQHAVGLVDVDNLSRVSTEIDHAKAGKIVDILAESLSEVLKPRRGFACVYGGDELYIYLPRNLRESELIMDVRFREAFERRIEKFPELKRLVKRNNIDFTGVVQDFSSDTPRIGFQPDSVVEGLSRQVNRIKKKKKRKGIVVSLSRSGREVNV